MSEIYFDNAATTKVSEGAAMAAFDVMTSFYGNPSSAHAKGLEAEHILKKARAHVLSGLGFTPKDGTLLFTSCGTESNNTVFFGAYEVFGKRKNNIVISDSEHPSVENCARELEKKGVEIRRIPTKGGKLSLDYAEKAIDAKTMLISCMLVNNETGAIFDIKALDAIRKRNASDAYLHTDAVQGFCKLPYSLCALGADLVSISGHKIHAPKGIGGLFIKKGIRIPTRMFGGGQEGGFRSGTENLAGIAAFGKAVEEYMNEKPERLHTIKELNFSLRTNLSEICPYVMMNSENDSAPHILSISVPGIRSEIMLRFLSERGIFVSAGSACSSKNADNRVLSNFGLSDKRADSTLRISFSKYNTKEETLILAKAIDEGNSSLIHTV